MEMPILALQLYSLKNELEADFAATLAAVAEMGYRAVELANPHGRSGEEWAEELQKQGLLVVGAHVTIEDLEEKWREKVDFQRAVGNRQLVVPVPQKGWENARRREYEETVGRLSALAERAAGEGLDLAYHNHHWEFAPFGAGDPGCGMEVLLEQTTPDALRFEVDTAWMTKGGWDVESMLRENLDRVAMIHAKEYRGSDDSEPPMGEGDVDFPPVIALAKARGWPVVVEYESEPSLDGVAHSARYLQELLGKK